MKRILIIVERRVMREFIVGVLESQFEIAAFSNGPDGVQESSKKKHDLVIVDSELPGADALDALNRFRKTQSSMPSIFLSAEGRDADATRSGANKVLCKPFTPVELVTAVKDLLP